MSGPDKQEEAVLHLREELKSFGIKALQIIDDVEKDSNIELKVYADELEPKGNDASLNRHVQRNRSPRL